jgi:two-component sensor histidine kinase
MGMKLIREIARLQLQGSVDFVDERGATVTLRFRIQ